MPSTMINPPEVIVGTTELSVGRSHEVAVHLSDTTISRLHATVSRQSQGILIVDHDSRYGTFKNGQPIRRDFARPGDRIRFGEKLTYRVTREGLKFEASHEGCALDIHGLRLDREETNTSPWLPELLDWSNRPIKRTKIIEAVNFSVTPNEFIGLLAPSGVGKSTLLESLAGYLKPMAGTITCDGKFDVYQELVRHTEGLAYLPQKDELYADLTVRENLFYAAKLRLEVSTSEPEIELIINETLKKVGLTEHADKRKLSGGQAKRLSVAMELLRSPRLLLLDEPCAGLDPASEAKLMELFRILARQGTTIVCSTHMLESMLWLDRVIVLGKRTNESHAVLAYDGPPQVLLSYFHCRQYADLYEKLESGHFEPLAGDSTPKSSGLETAEVAAVSAPEDQPERWLHQWSWQAKRLGLTIVRGSWQTLAFQPIFLGTLVCLTQYRSWADEFLRFFLVVVAIWLGLNNSIREIVDKRRVLYLRDRLAGVLPSSYFCSKVLVYFLVGLAQLSLLLVVYWFACWRILDDNTELKLGSIWHDLGFFTGLFIAYGGGVAMGLGASSLAKSETQAVGWLPLVLMPQLLLSAVATGYAQNPYPKGRGFQPLLAWATEENASPEQWTGKTVEVLSFLTISRPANLVIEAPSIERKNKSGELVPIAGTWLVDILHLMLITAAYWFVSYLLFLRGDRRWIQLKDLT